MRQAGGLIGCIGLLWALSAGSALGAGITNSGNDLRDGWYGNQPGLAPDLVGGSTFGKLWSAAVDGQVYAQPLVHAGHVIVATERNQVLSLDSETGAKTGSGSWGRTLPHGTPWNPSDVGCNDLRPDIGVTATPVIDDVTKTIYLTHKTYASGTSGPAVWWMDALDAATGDEKPGFPVKIEGAADNAPGVTFDPTVELQRPGLLLMDGVVYAAFGGHCDYGNYQGWVFGVSTAGAIKARWAASDWGAGIWQSGSGLMSDGPGRIFLATGNGGAPTSPRPGTKPGSTFGESVVRLAVQPDGSLQAKDFFAPYDAPDLDNWDADFASGGVTALRDDVFGTATYPHLALAVGKSGYVYTLNRDDLGGFRMGANGADNVISRVGPYGGVWARPAIWPGDGGWMVIPTSTSDTASPGSQGSGYLKMYQYSVVNGKPTMVARAQSTDLWGFSSGSAVITSDGKTSGTALAWAVHADGATGAGAQLRAYDAVPKNGKPNLRFSIPIGIATKFAMPGVGAGRIYVGTRDGHVLAFGAPVKAALQGPSTAFPTTTVGQSVTRDVTLTASGHLTITSVGSTTAPFDATYSGPSALDAGNTMTVSVTFHPTAPGAVGGAVHVVTSAGTFDFGLNGTGQANGPQLVASPPALSFGGTVAGASPLDGTVTFGNEGSEALAVDSVDLPSAPFTVDGVPAPGDTIASGAQIDLAVHFAPDAPGSYADEITLHTTGGTKTIGLSGTAGQGG
ncbi:MAG: Pyrrolo-quinoline quinone, partial [Conexibacter sp.]|nr:Pyrrolo-quinoline quinone [Conexibacter sp.]